jgi:hypothetical protein
VPVTREAIESFQPQAAVNAERDAWRDAYLKRVFRMHPTASAQTSDPERGSSR